RGAWVVVLGAVCVGAFVLVRLVGRFLATGRVRGAHLLDVVARVPLEPRRSLYVVEVAGKTLLVGTSEMGLSVLSELEAGEVKSRVTAQPSFGELVRAAWQRRKQRVRRDASPEAIEDARAAALSPDMSEHGSRGLREGGSAANATSSSIAADNGNAEAAVEIAPKPTGGA